MASYNRLGSYLLSDFLASVPSAKIHRALTTSGSAWQSHQLVSLFSDEVMAAGLESHAEEIQRNGDQLAGVRGFPANFKFEAGSPGHLACDYVPGRTLAQVLARVREEMVPLGVDHALTVLQGLAQSVLLLDEHNLHHGTLSLHSAWVAYEGATYLLDAPVASVLKGLLPRTPALAQALAPYRPQGPVSGPFQADLFAMGAILYEMLTLEPLPTGAALPGALDLATLKAAQEDAAIPTELLSFMKRLLLQEQPFTTAAEFQATLERVLYDGEYSPTTFNMAFLMHTLFRDENEGDGEAVKTDQGTNFTPFLPAGEAGAADPSQLLAPRRNGRKLGLVLAASGVVVAGAIGYMYLQMRQGDEAHQMEQKAMQSRLASLQAAKEANDSKLAQITKQEESQKTLLQMFGQQAEQASTAEARAAAKKDLEAAKQKAKDLAKERADALKEKQQLLQVQQAQARQGAAAQSWNQAAAANSVASFNAAASKAVNSARPSQPAPVAQAAAAPAASAAPSVTQKSTPQAPRGAALPASMQQTELKVSLKVFVDAAGRPLKTVITRGVEGSYGYNEAAQNAALASSYAPATQNGKPASGWLDMEFDFGKAK